MTEFERFKKGLKAVVSVPPETAEAIRRGEDPDSDEAAPKAQELRESGPEARRTSDACRRSRKRR